MFILLVKTVATLSHLLVAQTYVVEAVRSEQEASGLTLVPVHIIATVSGNPRQVQKYVEESGKTLISWTRVKKGYDLRVVEAGKVVGNQTIPEGQVPLGADDRMLGEPWKDAKSSLKTVKHANVMLENVPCSLTEYRFSIKEQNFQMMSYAPLDPMLSQIVPRMAMYQYEVTPGGLNLRHAFRVIKMSISQ